MKLKSLLEECAKRTQDKSLTQKSDKEVDNQKKRKKISIRPIKRSFQFIKQHKLSNIFLYVLLLYTLYFLLDCTFYNNDGYKKLSNQANMTVLANVTKR